MKWRNPFSQVFLYLVKQYSNLEKKGKKHPSVADKGDVYLRDQSQFRFFES